ncbi:MAG: hemin uptake protein HemP [Aquabacterium sp.]
MEWTLKPGHESSLPECDGGQEADAAPSADTPRMFDSQALFRGARVLHIQHEGTTYQLRLTRLGKLILTK